MTTEQINQLESGLYMVYWAKHEGGGFSMAAVGRRRNGDWWFSPTNWSTPDADLAKHWGKIEKMVLIFSKNQLRNEA